MSVKGYTGKSLYGTVITAVTSGAEQAWSGLADVTIEANRKIGMTKPLDEAGPVLVRGKLEGNLIVSGFITEAGLTGSDGITLINTALTSTPPTKVVVTVSNGTGSTAYTGYPTGKGIQFRQVADRVWVLDGVNVYKLID